MRISIKAVENNLVIKEELEDSRISPPETLKDIFKISNRNRKKNKLKKKQKGDMFNFSDGEDSTPLTSTSKTSINNNF